jgi:AcrR family transcriptional regulator
MAESTRIRLSTPERERRSHAARTAETRSRVIEAVIESIGEVGYQRTTSAEIARRAGVTWGAVQHHFGGKEGLLIAVVEYSFNRFAERLDDIPPEGVSLEKRAGLFIDRAWEHFGSALYRSTFEILLDQMGGADAGESPDWQREMFRAWNGVWMRLFGDSQLSRHRQLALQHFTISALSGLASTLMLAEEDTQLRRSELDLLKDTLVRELIRDD